MGRSASKPACRRGISIGAASYRSIASMLRYAHAVFNQVAQSAACNRFHSPQHRCCRWMLMTHDRMQSDEFLLTQEFLAMMLGVQRTACNGLKTGEPVSSAI
jgi:hypothetical protein